MSLAEDAQIPSEDDASQPKKPNVLSLTIRDRAVLYAAYMPFLKGGGLFIPTHKPYQIGDRVQLLLSLMDETEKLPTSAKVAWITPKAAQGNRAAGIGVQFLESEGAIVRNKIETYLAGMLQSDKPTHTF